MRKAINKLRSTPEVLTLLDAAGSLQQAEDKHLDGGLALYASTFPAYLPEAPSYLRESLISIATTARQYVTAFNDTFSQRNIKNDLKRLQANQTNYQHMRDHNAELEQKVHASQTNVDKKQRAHDKARLSGNQVEITKTETQLNAAKDQLQRDQKIFSEHNQKFIDEGVVYQKNIIEYLTVPLERMLESRKSTLLSVLDSGAEIVRVAEAMEFQEEDVSALEAQLETLVGELKEMGD
jgi:hypothetical protein